MFGIPALGILMSKVQSSVISSGSELEKMIVGRVRSLPDLDKFLSREIMPDGVFIASKKQTRNCSTLKFPQGEPDFLVFKRRADKQYRHFGDCSGTC